MRSLQSVKRLKSPSVGLMWAKSFEPKHAEGVVRTSVVVPIAAVFNPHCALAVQYWLPAMALSSAESLWP